jgi:hypothetical protein
MSLGFWGKMLIPPFRSSMAYFTLSSEGIVLGM